MSLHPLDADTALEPLGPGRWRGEVTDRWWVGRGPFGGYVATFLTRAMIAAVDDPARRPRSLTVHFAAAPPAPPPADCPRLERADGMPRFLDLLEVRWVEGGHPGAPAAEARNLAWLRPDPPRALDHLALTALSDGWMPAALSKLGRPAIVPTLDLTIHFRAPVATAGDWVLAHYASRFAAGGVWEQDGELWALDGTLLAQSRQLALIREAR